MNRRGFTLLETMVSLALIVLIAVMGWIFSTRYLEEQHVRAAAETVAQELALAQAESVAQINDAAHGILALDDRVIRFTGESFAARDPALDRETLFFGTFTISGTTEFVFPKARVAPSAAGVVTLSSSLLDRDVSISAYGVLESSERTVSP
jgi:prepilin-type N-terminal cleavage/methylation domain-containing protein